MNLGIVGVEGKKFTPETELTARRIIRELVEAFEPEYLVSGHCHLGGIDIFVEEEAASLGVPTLIYPPKRFQWEGGYKPRNLAIVRHSDSVFCLTIKELPQEYDGMRFKLCYHCDSDKHVKSGGCWTVKQALKAGKSGAIIVIDGDKLFYDVSIREQIA